MKSCLFRAALVPVVLVAVVAPGGAAAAQSLAISDPAGDTWRSTIDLQTEEESVEPAGSQTNTDLVRTVVRHTGRRVVLRATFAELRKADKRFAFMAKVRTNEGLKREAAVETFSRPGWGGTVALSKPDGAEVGCRGLAHTIDYAADTVSLSIPRHCLSRPRWLQVTVGAFSVDDASQDFSVFVDNGHDETADEPMTWSARLRRS